LLSSGRPGCSSVPAPSLVGSPTAHPLAGQLVRDVPTQGQLVKDVPTQGQRDKGPPTQGRLGCNTWVQ
jgi:hypothetical protein